MTAPLDPTKFAAARFAFLEGVADDADLPKIAARLAVKLASKYLRAETGGVAWPSIKSLCADLNVAADSAIRKALSAMVARGHLSAEYVSGATTRYSLAPKYFGTTPAHNDSQTPLQNEAGSDDTPPIFEAGTPVSFEADTPLQNEAGTPPIFEATSTGQGFPDNEYRTLNSGQRDSPPSPSRDRKPSERARAKARPPSPADSPADGFEEFWQAYPLKVGKIGAEKAFRKALGGGANPEEITLGAMRYAAERDREPDPAKRRKHTKHPAGWLNDGRWADDPAPAPAPVHGGLPIFGGGYAAPRHNPREGHGFRVMRVGEFQ